MGKHFDGLVELVRNQIDPRESSVSREGYIAISNIKEYLEEMINRAKFFEFPINAKSIRPTLDLDKKEYGKYLQDYFKVSQRYGKYLITPFPLVTIEDKESVVFFQHLEDNIYRVTNFSEEIKIEGINQNRKCLLIGDVKIEDPLDSGLYPCIANVLYAHLRDKENRIPFSLERDITQQYSTATDIVQATIAMIEQMVYIMDPANFIIEKESNASKKQNQKEKQGGKKILRKTINRPHYFCQSAEEIKHFLKCESKEPYPAHPVVGYYKTLTSPRWKNARYQEIFVSQYWTGDGEFIGRNGWNYRVFIKVAPDQVVPYAKAKEMNKKR